jgi:hypothetical protein
MECEKVTTANQKNETPVEKIVREHLEVIDDELDEGWPQVEVTRKNNQKPLLMVKFKHNENISPTYMQAEVPNKDRLQSAQEKLFMEMADKDVELTPQNFKALGYSRTHSYIVVKDAKSFLGAQ